MKRIKFVEYLAPVDNLYWLADESPEWSITALVIYNPTKRGGEVNTTSGCYQMFWPANPWAALDA